MAKAVWGIDVSKYSIKAVKVERSGAGETHETRVAHRVPLDLS